MPYLGTLTKAHIVDAVAERNGFTRKNSPETVEILLELIKQSLASGDDVLISGFGKLCVKKKTERRGCDPSTGADMMLKPRKAVTFQCAGNLREKLNQISAAARKMHHKVKDIFWEPTISSGG